MPEQEEQEIYATLVEVNQEPTELYKILKIGNLVSGGGEAKQVISEGYVFLNGEEETRKRKKVYAGDLVSFNGEYLQVALKGQTEDYEVVQTSTMDEIDFSSETPQKENQASIKESAKNKQQKKPTKRKPISF
ncbi:RNA-binding S4 domain-containing protein [Psychromonas sp. RZ22]|uniref:RNA-binding S4 domain-containing protein n=1 Tax=Psychromonas algarum TaxID=2555643 RepID=UPI0010684094|nr:RNA-binding S4 domain-containing protein [Psychromonas sp. RZ22]TEW53361.1 RNA-binding S4 domain-containing protein [Psychromonas sp. RZ22]